MRPQNQLLNNWRWGTKLKVTGNKNTVDTKRVWVANKWLIQATCSKHYTHCVWHKTDGTWLHNICEAENIKRKLCEKFKQLGLQITADTNMTVVDFLDVTLDLKKKEYKPFSKPGNTHLYVHTKSNHPPVITKRIPQSIETRLSNISSNEDIFKHSKQEYEKALKEAGHQATLTYTPSQDRNNSTKEQRKRRITWFNPPYSQHVKTNIGKKFLALVDKCFPKQNEIYKICNRSTLKISYSCMNNIETIIKTHNSSIINKENNKTPDTCNCRKKEECPLPGKCTIQNVIYEAKVTTENDEKRYIGLTATPFKTRYSSHKSSFNNRDKSNQTELSEHIWIRTRLNLQT